MFGEGRGKALIEGIEIAVTEPLLNDAAKDLFVLFDGHRIAPFSHTRGDERACRLPASGFMLRQVALLRCGGDLGSSLLSVYRRTPPAASGETPI
jgi:hypothetical protein